MKRLANYFIRGMIVFVPSALTVFAIVWAFTTLDGILRNTLHIKIPGLGILLLIAIIFTLGVLASNFIGRKLFKLIDKIFAHIPIAKLLYSAAKDFIKAFTGDHKSFDKPVLVELIPNGPSAVGFVTMDDLEFLHLPGHVAVYMPQSYNFAGQMLLFPSDRVKSLDVDSADAMKFIVSGGVSVF